MNIWIKKALNKCIVQSFFYAMISEIENYFFASPRFA